MNHGPICYFNNCDVESWSLQLTFVHTYILCASIFLWYKTFVEVCLSTFHHYQFSLLGYLLQFLFLLYSYPKTQFRQFRIQRHDVVGADKFPPSGLNTDIRDDEWASMSDINREQQCGVWDASWQTERSPMSKFFCIFQYSVTSPMSCSLKLTNRMTERSLVLTWH